MSIDMSKLASGVAYGASAGTVATLDSRNTPVCRARGHKIYPLDGPKPPAHWGCRSSIVPALKPEYQREIPGSTRPSVGPDGVEQVSSGMSYGD